MTSSFKSTMFQKSTFRLIIVILCATIVSADKVSANSSISSKLRLMSRIYEKCERSTNGVWPCLRRRANNFIDRILQMKVIHISDDLKIISVDNDKSDQQTADASAGSEVNRHFTVDNVLVKVAKWLSERAIQVRLSKVTWNDKGSELKEEGKENVFLSQHSAIVRSQYWV